MNESKPKKKKKTKDESKEGWAAAFTESRLECKNISIIKKKAQHFTGNNVPIIQSGTPFFLLGDIFIGNSFLFSFFLRIQLSSWIGRIWSLITGSFIRNEPSTVKPDLISFSFSLSLCRQRFLTIANSSLILFDGSFFDCRRPYWVSLPYMDEEGQKEIKILEIILRYWRWKASTCSLKKGIESTAIFFLLFSFPFAHRYRLGAIDLPGRALIGRPLLRFLEERPIRSVAPRLDCRTPPFSWMSLASLDREPIRSVAARLDCRTRPMAFDFRRPAGRTRSVARSTQK